MGKIVLEHYPVSKLPRDLRAGMPDNAMVRVTVEEEGQKAPDEQKLRDLMNRARRNAGKLTLEEAVQRVRELRDEWD
jgi:hypothetical protein